MKKNIMRNAGELAQSAGNVLVGRKILTAAVGDYPGGWATITEINPDKNAPEIVMTVNNPVYGEIGVFDYEIVGIR